MGVGDAGVWGGTCMHMCKCVGAERDVLRSTFWQVSWIALFARSILPAGDEGGGTSWLESLLESGLLPAADLPAKPQTSWGTDSCPSVRLAFPPSAPLWLGSSLIKLMPFPPGQRCPDKGHLERFQLPLPLSGIV